VIYWIYEYFLQKKIVSLPEHICFMISGGDMENAPSKLEDVVNWCRDLGLNRMTVHISIDQDDDLRRYYDNIKKIGEFAALSIHMGDEIEESGEGMQVLVAVGKSGREEIAECIRKMAEKGVDPESVNEDTFEEYLTFRYEPDLVIKSGGDHLTDFLIWQSVYSEIFFMDINWAYLRRVDLLRAIRDYQSRARRFGR